MRGQGDTWFVWIKSSRQCAKTIFLDKWSELGLTETDLYLKLTICASKTLSSQLPPGKRLLSHCLAWSKFSHISLLIGVTVSVMLNNSVCISSTFLLHIGGSTRIIFENGILLGGLKNDVARVLWYRSISWILDQRLMSTHRRTLQLILLNVHKARPGAPWGPIFQEVPIWIKWRRLQHSPKSL